MVVGRVEVASGGLLQLHGMVVGEVLVHVDGGAQLWGTVKGDVQNLGGAAHIYGMIDGKVLHRSGSTTYYQGAVFACRTTEVSGRRLSRNMDASNIIAK